MPRKPADITDAELPIVNLLWQHRRMTVRDLANCLYRRATAAQYATISKQLDRLERKNVVKRDRKVWPYEFESAIGRDCLIGKRMQATADKLCGGSLVPLLSCLVRGNLDRRQISTLRNLIDELITNRSSIGNNSRFVGLDSDVVGSSPDRCAQGRFRAREVKALQ